ncbi:hypothetical protein BD410DRAFT_783716 [Rickenella mellea]|uniref:BTB domain-containing protein n=1 Tax=Rickenella mellea TaxID=50990 RepID=A0A4Y7QHE3_9AGAM|nr:hypothetical protein BD410DRAFT_783716 [Rickenella mellea]
MPRLAAEHHDDALPMEEPSEIIKTLLDIIYPRATDPVLPFVSFAFVRRLLRAAEKYDLERVHHYVRLLTLTRPFLSKPLEVYSLACMFGWAEDAHRISFQTLNLDLSSPVHADILESLDSASLYKLFQVRWRIKEEVTEAMEMLKRRHENEEWGCDCGSNLLDDEEWDCLHRLIRGEFG